MLFSPFVKCVGRIFCFFAAPKCENPGKEQKTAEKYAYKHIRKKGSAHATEEDTRDAEEQNFAEHGIRNSLSPHMRRGRSEKCREKKDEIKINRRLARQLQYICQVDEKKSAAANAQAKRDGQ